MFVQLKLSPAIVLDSYSEHELSVYLKKMSDNVTYLETKHALTRDFIP